MIHPNTELRFVNQAIGYGVFATRFIPRGTITWVGDSLDQKFTRDPYPLPELLAAELDKYSFRDNKGTRILCWDHARYINHSCEANCLSADFNFELAIRDIHPDEELTDDYGTLNIDTAFACLCGSPRCRKVIRPDDLLRYASMWDKIVRESLPDLINVAQPLWALLQEKDRLTGLLSGQYEWPSVATHYYSVKALPDLRHVAK